MKKNTIIALILGVCMMAPQAVFADETGRMNAAAVSNKIYADSDYDSSKFPSDLEVEKKRVQGVWSHPSYGDVAGEIFYFHGDWVNIYTFMGEEYPKTLSSDNMYRTYTYDIVDLYETFPEYNQVVTGWKILINREEIPANREDYEYWDIREYWQPQEQRNEYYNDILRAYSFYDGAYYPSAGAPNSLSRMDISEFTIIE